MKPTDYIIIVALTLSMTACSGEKAPTEAEHTGTYPPIFPDYIGVTIPASIAPMNFNVDDAERIDVTIKGSGGTEIRVLGHDCCDIPMKEWRRLLSENIGDSIYFQVSAKSNGTWSAYRPFGMYVSADSIDYGLTYRLIAPGYEVYSKLGIYERNLSDFTQTGILENTQVDGCMNCHSYNQCDPEYFNLHVRGAHGATLLRIHGNTEVYNTKTDSTISSCVYPYWHPSGRYIAYSVNDTHQMVHSAENKKVEVFDLASDVQVYDTEAKRLIAPSILKQDKAWETFPAFSPDGKSLYYCSAASVTMPDSIREVRYDLCRIDFDPETGTFGEKIDTLVNASRELKSVSFPRPSFDGRYLMYTLSDYGNFSIWHHEADLWLLDLRSGETRPLTEANSDDTESYHNWSSNSRWIVFASRRGAGDYTCPYISHIDGTGTATKPVLLPQRNPREYYDGQFRSFNIPEFVSRPVDLDRSEAERLLKSPERKQF